MTFEPHCINKMCIRDRVKALAKAASDCWDTIIAHDLSKFATSYMASFNAQIDMSPPLVW